MSMSVELLPDKDVLSTGELASILHVTKHTIITAIERQELRASRTPGGHNRISREDALDFMRRYNYLPNDSQMKRVLVVDDEEHVFEIMKYVFTKDEYEIFHAKTGYEAGKLAERMRPELIILDILLPDVDGRDVCRHIREEDFGRTCRILAVSSICAEDEIQEVYESGIDDFLSKPFTIEKLREKVNTLVVKE